MRKRSRPTVLAAALGLAAALPVFAHPAAARADDDKAEVHAPIEVGMKESVDFWQNTEGGLKRGGTTLNKLQAAFTLDGDALGAPGWRGHIHLFRTNGETLSNGRLGDIQTASNIEALSVTRLMEAWGERKVGPLTLKIGLMDLNADFDSVGPAGLFLNSSHGIAPDLSQSGLNGPSIFPVSSFGVHAVWEATSNLTLRGAVFDGVPGDPNHPKAFAAVKLSAHDGALMISQADWAFAKDAQASLGLWGYTGKFDRLDHPGRDQQGQGGVFASVQGPLAPHWTGWVRAGVADTHVNLIGDYLGFGVVREAPLPGRPDDQLGFGVARAGLGPAAQHLSGLPSAETALELSYRIQVTGDFALQPDVQYIINPASRPGLDNALAVGLRVTFTIRRPAGAEVE